MRILVLPVQFSMDNSAGEIGWALVTLLSCGEIEHHTNSGAVSLLLTPIGSVVVYYFKPYFNLGTATLI